MCTMKSNHPRESTTIMRYDLSDVEEIRIDKDGRFVDETKSIVPRNSLGYSARFKVVSKESGIGSSRLTTYKYLQFSHHDLGKRHASNLKQQIKKYINKTTERVRFNNGKVLTSHGTMAIVAGIMAICFTCIFGQWSDPVPKHKKMMRKAM